jgi:putative SOS response-associated peptidase YedK
VQPQINVQTETLTEKPFFREALAQRRCLVLADSFYEWKREGKHSTPYRILLNTEEPFAFAGIWDRIPGSQGESLPHFAIITTASNTLVSTIHDRMSVILRKEDEPRWLDPAASATAIAPLLQSYPATELKLYAVSPRVNSPKMDNPDLILPV